MDNLVDCLCNSGLFVQRHMCHVQLKFMCKHGVDVDFIQHISQYFLSRNKKGSIHQKTPETTQKICEIGSCLVILIFY